MICIEFEAAFCQHSYCEPFHPVRPRSLRWFKETQARHVLRADGTVYEWFHGFISKRRSEELLDGKPEGFYLVRTNDTHFGYHLSIRCV